STQASGSRHPSRRVPPPSSPTGSSSARGPSRSPSRGRRRCVTTSARCAPQSTPSPVRGVLKLRVRPEPCPPPAASALGETPAPPPAGEPQAGYEDEREHEAPREEGAAADGVPECDQAVEDDPREAEQLLVAEGNSPPARAHAPSFGPAGATPSRRKRALTGL